MAESRTGLGSDDSWTKANLQARMDVLKENRLTVTDKQHAELLSRHTELDKQVASLHSGLKAIGVVTTILLTATLAFFGTLLWQGVKLSQRVSYLEGQKGNPLQATIQGLQSPGSDQKLSANLNLIAAQARDARVQEKKPKPADVKQLSGAVAKVAEQQPKLPEVWMAASQLISLSSPLQSAAEQPCGQPKYGDMVVTPFSHDKRAPTDHEDNPVAGYQIANLQDCSLTIDDVSAFKTVSGLEDRLFHDPHYHLTLILTRVHLVYRGGALIPVTRIECTSCTYDFEVPGTLPPPRGQSLTKQLLTADLASPKGVSVDIGGE